MDKKINRTRKKKVSSNSKKSPKKDEHKELLNTIHNKLDSSAVLNGGFDRLIYTIEGMERNQNQIVDKVEKIHEAIYHPDDGLFSRIASNKSSQNESFSKVENQISQIIDWKDKHSELHDDKNEMCEQESDDIQEKIIKIEHSLSNVEKFQTYAFSAAKWLLAGIAGVLLSYVVETLSKVK